MQDNSAFLELLRCPRSGAPLTLEGGYLVAGSNRYRLSESGVPMFAEAFLSPDALRQQEHYDRVSEGYLENLDLPQTQEYGEFLDELLLERVTGPVDTLVELCSGRGEAVRLPGLRYRRALALDVSLSMVEAGRRDLRAENLCFLQADVTRIPLIDACSDAVFTLGGIHHVPDRQALFDEVSRILRPGGRFYWREPLDDFLPWRLARKMIYRVSSVLDADTERPLRYDETEPQLRHAGLRLESWRTSGFVAWCLLMNSDVLHFNRAAKYLPGVRALTRLGTRLDEGLLSLPGCSGYGAQVVGEAVKV